LTFRALAAVAASSSSTSDVQAGVLGFLVVAAMGVALVFLLRSMTKQFRKITPDPASSESGSGGPGGPGEEQPVGQETPR